MEVLRYPLTYPSPPGGTVATIGAYDGVHRGHRSVLADVRRLAAERGARSAVVTFDRHPASVVRPESAPLLLTDLEQRLELLAGAGVDLTLVVRFDEIRAKESAEDFVKDVLVEFLGIRAVVVGADFHFGNARRGNVALLTEMGADLGFEVVGVDLVGVEGVGGPDGAPVSSTAVRAALGQGRLADANEMLGRAHEVRGVVRSGDRRARELGFPTANVSVPDGIRLPAEGIYAGWYVRPDGQPYAAAISLGRRPTFYDQAHAPLLEAHLLGFSGDLYGERARVQFVAHLRDELRFDSVDELVEQMGRDCDDARHVLGL